MRNFRLLLQSCKAFGGFEGELALKDASDSAKKQEAYIKAIWAALAEMRECLSKSASLTTYGYFFLNCSEFLHIQLNFDSTSRSGLNVADVADVAASLQIRVRHLRAIPPGEK